MLARDEREEPLASQCGAYDTRAGYIGIVFRSAGIPTVQLSRRALRRARELVIRM